MKQQIRNFILVLRITQLIVFNGVLSLMVFSCQTEETFLEKEPSHLIVKKISEEQVFENNRILSRLNELTNPNKKLPLEADKSFNKIVYDSTYNFTIDTDNCIFTDDGISQTYTFPIFRDNKPFVSENLIIKIEQNEISTYLFDYQEDIDNFKNLTQDEIYLKEIKKYKISNLDNTDQMLAKGEYDNSTEMVICADVFVYTLVEYHEGDLTGGPLYEWKWLYIGQECYFASGGLSGGSSGSGGNVSSGGGASNTSPSNINTAPTTISYSDGTKAEFDLITNLYSENNISLTSEQIAWFNRNSQKLTEIIVFLGQNNNSAESLLFLKELITISFQQNIKFNLPTGLLISTLNFNTLNDLNNHLLSNAATLESTDLVLNPIDQNEKTAIAKFSYGTFGVSVKIKQEMSPDYKIKNVTSNKTGVSILLSWEQTSYSVDEISESSYVKIDVFGILTTGIKITVPFEANITIESEVHYEIIVNKNTGAVVSAIEVND